MIDPPVLSTLSAEQLPTYALTLEEVLRLATGKADIEATLKLRLQDRLAMAQGLLARSRAAAEAGHRWWLAGESEAEGQSTLYDAVMEVDGQQSWQPIEVMRTGWASSQWAVIVPIGGADGTPDGHEVDLFPTRHAAEALCARATLAPAAAAQADPPEAKEDAPQISTTKPRTTDPLYPIPEGVERSDMAEARAMVAVQNKGALALRKEFGWDDAFAQRFAIDVRAELRGDDR